MLHRITLAFIICIAMLSQGVKAFAQKDKIEGLWFNEEKTAKIQIYRAVDNKFWGKIVWLKEPVRNGKPRVDEKNSKPGLRNRPLLNMAILSHFVKDGDNKYTDGEIYDPKNGKTYSCTITYRSAQELGIRGYIGISLIGRTTTWTRAD
jgi:uncharacterized protein (DUF2147 family)